MNRAVPAILVVLAITSPASADLEDGPFVSGGVALGGARHDAETSFILGAEISGGYLWDTGAKGEDRSFLDSLFDYAWIGGYADAIVDFENDQTRVSFGPELGRAIAGVDAGLLLEFGDAQRTGISVRPALTFGIMSTYVRFGHFFDELQDSTFIELGVLLKKAWSPK